MGSRWGCRAVTIRHDDGPWTTAAYTSIDAMHRLPVFAQFEIDGVRIVLAESVTNGATHKADGSRDEWTRPAMAYAGEADLLTFGRQIGGGKTLTYILPKPVSKPVVPRPYDTAPFPDPPPHASRQRTDPSSPPRDIAIVSAMQVWNGARKKRGKYEGAPKWKVFVASLTFPATIDRCKALWLKSQEK